ncbi:MAG: hypothetical protein GX649_12810 [Chloroflexi bacterium]|nr:hypothetical protein [Chloroflexota bacterium]
MTTGLERVRAALRGELPDRTPIAPILHAMGARLIGVPIGRYASDAGLMARAILAAYERFGYDGVQLSLGVAAEAEALGAPTAQPEDGLPVVTRPLLEEPADLARLALPDVRRAGRLGLFVEAVGQVAETVGQEAWVVATLRGPLLMATQLRGVEQFLVDLLERPAWCAELLTFTTEVGAAYGRVLVEAGAHAVAIGEATSSPDFIAPRLFREQILPYHGALITALHAAGAEATVMHICGRALPIVGDVAATGCDVMDIDSQVNPGAAAQVAGRMALRGNIEPAGVLLYGEPALVEERVREALAAAEGNTRFILGSGCDVPPDTPPENIAALVRAGRRYGAG